MLSTAPSDAKEPARQTLSPMGWAGVVLVSVGIAASIAVWVESAGARMAADRLGEEVLGRADTLLEEVDAELGALSMVTSTLDSTTPDCSDSIREALLRASLRSAVAVAFVQVGPDGLACGPSVSRAFVDAVGPDDIALAAKTWGPGLMLRPAVTLAAGLVVARTIGEGNALAGTLEPRRVREYLGTVSLRTTDPSLLLRTRESAPLVLDSTSPRRGAPRLGGMGGRAAETGDDRFVLYRAVRASSSWPIDVVTTVDAGVVAARIGQSAPTWLLMAGLLAGGLSLWLKGRIGRRDRPEARLRRALRKRRFEPVVQAIVDARTGECVGAEVLMRWAHPIRGLISPMEFIGLAEATGLIVPISDLLVAKARDQLAPLARRHPSLYFAFNIAPAQLRDPGFADRLTQAFDETSLAPGRVLLEITERDAVDDDAMRGVEALRARGFRLAIDDFGTGHSSLAALERLKVDRIKIDREFVRRIDEPGASRVVLEAMIALVQRLATPIVAEGVETEAQRSWLAAQGVEFLQGFLFSRPIAVADFARWLDRAAAESATATPAQATPETVSDPATSGAVSFDLGTSRSDGLSFAAAGARLAELDLDRVCAAMRGPDGLDVRDRSWRLTTWSNCFIGSEAVDWISMHLGLDRAQAVRLGQRLAANGLLEHVAQEHDFADAMLFYRFTERETVEAAGAAALAMSELRDLAREMRSPGGLALRAHDWRGIRYRDAFSGAQATHWLAQRLQVDREQAEDVGRALLRIGAIRHVDDERPYRSNGEPFRFG